MTTANASRLHTISRGRATIPVDRSCDEAAQDIRDWARRMRADRLGSPTLASVLDRIADHTESGTGTIEGRPTLTADELVDALSLMQSMVDGQNPPAALAMVRCLISSAQALAAQVPADGHATNTARRRRRSAA